MKNWHVYIIKCGDGTLYTGISTDVDRRFAEHQKGGPKASRYLKGRGPLQLMLTLHVCDQGTALKLEHRIKRLSKARKEALIQHPETLHQIHRTLNNTNSHKKS
jgi:putative endonuclease